MTCREFREAHPGLEGDARRHLDGCAECRAFARSWELLGELGPITPQPGFFERVRRRLVPRRVRWLAPLGAAAALLLVGIMVWQSAPPPPPTPVERELAENLEILENLELLQSLELVNDVPWPLGGEGGR